MYIGCATTQISSDIWLELGDAMLEEGRTVTQKILSMLTNFGKMVELFMTQTYLEQVVGGENQVILNSFPIMFWSRKSAKPLPRYRPHKVACHWQGFLSMVFFSISEVKKLPHARRWTWKHLGSSSIMLWHISGHTSPHGHALYSHNVNIYAYGAFFTFFGYLRCFYGHWG